MVSVHPCTNYPGEDTVWYTQAKSINIKNPLKKITRYTRLLIQTGMAGNFLGLLLFANVLYAGELPDSFSIGDTPAFVKVQPLNGLIDQGDNSGSLDYLLVDDQVNRLGDRQYYQRYAYKVNNKEGIESGSTINHTYNPALQEMIFHHISVIRDGQTIDKLDPESIEVLRREKDLANEIYDGRLTVNIILDDIRQGDIIDYSFTIKGMHPLLEGMSFGYFDIEWSVPVARYHRRLLWPDDKALYLKYYLKTVLPTVIQQDGYKEYIWEDKNISPVISDGDDVPSWHDEYAWILYTETDSWQAVKNKVSDVYRVTDDYVNSTRQIAEQIQQSAGTTEEKLIQAMHFVQDEIRYTGILLGVNSYIPHPPSVVLQRRYGDCKDKTVLFLSVLKHLGIEAYPVLANTDSYEDLSRYNPALNLFNHVISKVIMDGKSYWIDLTRNQQATTLDNLYQPDYGSVLVIDGSDEGLVKMNTADIPDLTLEVSEVFDMSNDIDGPVKYTIESRYYSYRAESIRSSFASETLEAIDKQYFDYMNDMFEGNLEKGAPMSFNDDLVNNVLTVQEQYLVNNIWNTDEDGKRSLNVYQYEINDLLVKPEPVDRTSPFKLTHPVYVHQNTRFIMPETWEVDESTDEIENSGIYFRSILRGMDNIIELDTIYRSKNNFISADEIPEYLKDIEEIKQNIQVFITHENEVENVHLIRQIFTEFDIRNILLLFLPPLLLILFMVCLFRYKGTNPWFSVWWHPKNTMGSLINNKRPVAFIVLVIIMGMAGALDTIADRNLGDQFQTVNLWIVIIFIGPCVGLLGVYLWAWILSVTGKWIEGRADQADMRLVTVWSSVPTVVQFVLYILLFLVIGDELFRSEYSLLENNLPLACLILGAGLVIIMLGVLQYVLHVAMIAKVQGFTVMKSIGNVLLAMMMLIVPLLAIILAGAFIYSLFFGTT